MAVNAGSNPAPTASQSINPASQRWVVGTNVLLMTILALVVTGFVQYGGYQLQTRVGGQLDLTSAGSNRLTAATEKLLARLDKQVWITSLYYTSDEQGKDQAQYRGRIEDLIRLYQIANRGKVEVDTINPIKDRERHDGLQKRLADIPKFKEESTGHIKVVNAFKDDLAPKLAALIDSELSQARTLNDELGEAGRGEVLPQLVERVWPGLQQEVQQSQESITEAINVTPPRYAAVVPELTSLYNALTQTMTNIGTEGAKEAAKPGTAPKLVAFLNGAKDRLRDTINMINVQVTEARNLKSPAVDALLSRLQGSKSNALVVGTDEDARVIDFNDIWPPVNPNVPANVLSYKDRDFRGEEKLTSAILRMTSTERTGVVFIRYGGQPLFAPANPFGGSPGGVMTRLKERLEETNFQVDEWDLATQPSQPTLDPAPKRTVFVVLKPSPPRGPTPQGQIPFGEFQQQVIKTAIDGAGRSLFMAGWAPLSIPNMPPISAAGTYEFGPYLKDTWGIDVDASHLIMTFVPISPGKFGYQPGAELTDDYRVADHVVTQGLTAYRATFPMATPLNLSPNPPGGALLEKLIWTPSDKDNIWGVGELQKLEEQLAGGFLQKLPDDLLGPFTLAASGSKGDKKVAVISARMFVDDALTSQGGWVQVGNGFVRRLRSPGNVTLFINLLHWLNDNTEWMNIGRPIEPAILTIEQGATLKTIRWLAFAIWPALALACGGVVWWVRRR